MVITKILGTEQVGNGEKEREREREGERYRGGEGSSPELFNKNAG